MDNTTMHSMSTGPNENFSHFTNFTSDDPFNFFTPTARYFQFSVILIVSCTSIITNIINITILRKTKEIPVYSRNILTNLATIDLTSSTIVCLPCVIPALTGRWPYGDIWCQFASVIYGCCCGLSVWNIATVALERYLATVHPVKFKQYMSSRHLIYGIISSWIITLFVFCVPIFATPNLIYYKFYVAHVMCGFYWESYIMVHVTGLLYPTLSAVVIVFFSVNTIKALKKVNPVTNVVNGSTDPPTSNQNDGRTRRGTKAVRIVIATATTYFVTWWPLYMTTILSAHKLIEHFHVSPWIEFIAVWIANSNSCMNMWIYSAIFSSFRRNMAKTLCCFLYGRRSDAQILDVNTNSGLVDEIRTFETNINNASTDNAQHRN